MDGTANPYMFVGAVILAALDGLENNTAMVWRDCSQVLGGMNLRWRAFYGIQDYMPLTLGEAVESLKNNHVLQARIGRELITRYIHVKEKEATEFRTWDFERRRIRFLEHF